MTASAHAPAILIERKRACEAGEGWKKLHEALRRPAHIPVVINRHRTWDGSSYAELIHYRRAIQSKTALSYAAFKA